MKKIILLLIAFCLLGSGYSQKRVFAPESLRNKMVIKNSSEHVQTDNTQSEQPFVKSASMLVSEEQIGDTRYDIQTNASVPNRIYRYADGTIGAIWTRGVSWTSHHLLTEAPVITILMDPMGPGL